MTEELKPGEGQEEIVKPEVKEPQYTDLELKALDMGWRPKEDFEGEEDDFIEAKEFVRRKPLFEKIEQQSRALKNTQKALAAFKDHYSKVKETEYKNALASLKAEQKKALVDGDTEKFYALEDARENVEKEASDFVRGQKEIDVQDSPVVHPEFAAWLNRNNWYQNQSHMRIYADETGDRLAQTGLSPSEVLIEVEKAVRKEFPQKFHNPNRDKPSAVAGASAGKRPNKNDSFELDDTQKRVMKTLVDGGHITAEKYIADIKKAASQERK